MREKKEKLPGEPPEAGTVDAALVRYVGRNPSYTIGKLCFKRGEVRQLDPAFLDAALASGKFERA